MLDTSNGIGIEIDRKKVYHYSGYGADYKPPARVSSLIDEYAEHIHHLIEPAYSYLIKNIERRCLMLPRKSMPGIIGIGLGNDNVGHYNPCQSGDKHDCEGRREK